MQPCGHQPQQSKAVRAVLCRLPLRSLPPTHAQPHRSSLLSFSSHHSTRLSPPGECLPKRRNLMLSMSCAAFCLLLAAIPQSLEAYRAPQSARPSKSARIVAVRCSTVAGIADPTCNSVRLAAALNGTPAIEQATAHSPQFMYASASILPVPLKSSVTPELAVEPPSSFASNSGATTANPLTVPAGGGEYPMLDGMGTTVADISGNGNTLTFAAGTNSPEWLTYGVDMHNTGLVYFPAHYITTPFSNFGTVYIASCTPVLVTSTGTASGGTPAVYSPTVMGSSSATTGVYMQSIGRTGSTFNSVQPTIVAASTGALSTSLTDAYGGCHVYGYSMGVLGTSTDHITVDGQEPANYNSQGASSANTAITGGTYNLGWGGTSGTGRDWRGVMTYLVVYPYGTTHTVAQMATETNYIQSQLNNRGTYPIYPTYSNSRSAQLLLVGDSLTAGYEGSAVWSLSLSTTNTYVTTDLGIGGMTSMDMCKQFEQRVAPYIVKGQTTIQLWGGTNDLAFGGTAAGIWTSLTSCVSKAHAAGARIIVATMIDRAGLDTPHDSLDAIIRKGWMTAGFDGLNDLAEAPGLGADAANTNTACFNADRVHLTPASGPLLTGTCGYIGNTQYSGYGLVATMTSNAINTIDGSSQVAPDTSSSNAFVSTYANNYVIQTPTAAATYTLVDCQGQSSARTVVNSSASYTITISAVNSQAIAGSLSITPGSVARFIPILAGDTTGGCSWLRVQ